MGNVSGLDRFVRIVVGLLISIFVQVKMMPGLLSTVLLIVGIAIILTGVFGWCGVYSLFGCSTKKNSNHRISKKDIQKAVESHMNATKAAVVEEEKPKKKTSTKKASTKKTTKKVVKKSATKKSVAKKTPAKKAVKKTTKKTN